MWGRVSVIAALLAAAALAALSVPAHAVEMPIEPGGEIVTSGSLTFNGGGVTVRCDTTIQGDIGEAVTLESEAQLGELHEVWWSECSGGTAAAVLGLAWSLNYEQPLGTYPDSLDGLELAIPGMGLMFGMYGGIVNCLYGGDLHAVMLLELEEPDGRWLADELDVVPTGLARHSGSFLCPSSVVVAGALALEPQQVLGRLAARLRAELPNIPGEQTRASLVLRNVAASGSHNLKVRTITIIGAGGDRPELFAVPGEDDHCTEALLAPAGASACTTDIRYVGEAGQRPATARVQVAFHNGRSERSRDIGVRAN